MSVPRVAVPLSHNIELCPAGLMSDFGRLALRSLANGARAAITKLDDPPGNPESASAALGRVRGTGVGVSFGLLVRAVEVAFAAPLQAPFENSASVAGAPIRLNEALDENRDDGLLRLQFAPGAVDLPLHAHDDSARCIFVVRGRGFFHVAGCNSNTDPIKSLRHVAVRSRDVLVFRKGTIHTFSTSCHALELFSFHAPFVELQDERQYRIIRPVVYPALRMCSSKSSILFDGAWSPLAGD